MGYEYDDHISIISFTVGTISLSTPSIVELADHTTVKPVGVLDDIVVSIASWEYPVDFMVLKLKDPSKCNHIILVRPWLAAFIGCRDGEMTISNGLSTQKLSLYPPAQPVTKTLWWLEFSFGDENIEDILFPSDYSCALQKQTTKNVLNQFVSSTTCIDFP